MNTRIVVFILFCASACVAQDTVTALKILPIYVEHKVALSEALAKIGLHVQGGYVSFGIDLRNDPEPQVELNLRNSTTLGDALVQVTSQARGYTYQVASKHLIDVYPVEAMSDPTDILNLRVDNFAVSHESALNIFTQPKRFIPRLRDYLLKDGASKACGSLGPGLGSLGPGVTLSLEGVTLKQLLDAVAEADAEQPDHAKTHTAPVGWVHRMTIDPKTGPVHSWSFLSTAPHGWERFLQQR